MIMHLWSKVHVNCRQARYARPSEMFTALDGGVANANAHAILSPIEVILCFAKNCKSIRTSHPIRYYWMMCQDLLQFPIETTVAE